MTTIGKINGASIAELAYDCGGDMCLSFFAKAYQEGWFTFPPGAQVLEIGCAEADWQTPMLKLEPTMRIIGIDWRDVQRPGEFVRGDVMCLDEFERESFDAIVSISAIEHVGLGVYDDDPKLGSGDIVAMTNARYWLKQGGWMYLDVPFRPGKAFEVHDNFRAYNERALHERILPGFVLKQWARCETEHPDGPYIAMLLEKQ